MSSIFFPLNWVNLLHQRCQTITNRMGIWEWDEWMLSNNAISQLKWPWTHDWLLSVAPFCFHPWVECKVPMEAADQSSEVTAAMHCIAGLLQPVPFFALFNTSAITWKAMHLHCAWTGKPTGWSLLRRPLACRRPEHILPSLQRMRRIVVLIFCKEIYVDCR